jgi:cephalosporin-C deacetylase-like acetyl esterase
MKMHTLKWQMTTLLLGISFLGSPVHSQAVNYAVLCRVFDTPAQQKTATQMLSEYQTNQQVQSDQIRAKVLSTITTRAQVLNRARAVRDAYIKSMGGLPAEKVPLDAKVVGEIDHGDYIIRKVLFQDFAGMWVPANLYLPKPLGNTPRPAVLAPMGHGSSGKDAHWYQERTIQLVKFGYIVLGYDPVGMGERWQYWDPQTGKSLIGNRDTTGALTRKEMSTTDEHSYMGVQAWLVGQSISQYMVWDGMRGIDYLLTLPEVDPHRIAVSGASLGGSTTMMLAAIDPRVTCAVPTCDVTSYLEMAKANVGRDAEQIPLGITAEHFEEADALLPMLLQNGSAMINANAQDFFPIAGSRQAAKELEHLYGIAGVPGRFAFAENQGTHGWFPGTYASFYTFLGQQFSFGPPNPTHQVTTTDTLKEAQLWCTEQGQVNAPPLNSKTVFDRTAETATHLARAREKQTDVQIIEAARKLSGAREILSAPAATYVGQSADNDILIDKWIVTSEPGIQIPAVYIHLKGQQKLPGKVLLYSSPEGKNTVFNPEKFPLRQWLQMGNAVLAVDARGWGETEQVNADGSPMPPFPIYSHLLTIAFNALQNGRTLVGERATDLLAAARWLDAQKGKWIAQHAEISLWGNGSAGVSALHAVAADTHHLIHNAVLDQTLYSYQDWATTRLYNVPVELVIPGVMKDYDLPRLALAVQRRVIWINPLDATGHELSGRKSTFNTTPIITGEPVNAANQALSLLK